MFMTPLPPPQRQPSETYAEDRAAILLADKLGYCEALVGEHVTDLAENVTSCLMFLDRKSTRLNSSHDQISYAVFCLKKKKKLLIDLVGHRLERRSYGHLPMR